MLRDDSKVQGSLDGHLSPTANAADPTSQSSRSRETRIVPITPEARAKAIRRALRDDSKVRVELTDPRKHG